MFVVKSILIYMNGQVMDIWILLDAPLYNREQPSVLGLAYIPGFHPAPSPWRLDDASCDCRSQTGPDARPETRTQINGFAFTSTHVLKVNGFVFTSLSNAYGMDISPTVKSWSVLTVHGPPLSNLIRVMRRKIKY